MIIPAYRRNDSSTWVLQFINIVFLIMLFFLVGGTVSEMPDPDVSPPITLQGEAASPPQNSLYIKANGALVFNGESLTIGEFISRWSNTKPLTIVADRQLKAHILLQDLALLRASGINDMVLTTVKFPS